MLFNSTYYLAKQKRSFSNFPNLLYLQEENKTSSTKNCCRNDCAAGHFTEAIGEAITVNTKRELTICKYFCILSDGIQTVA